MGKQMRSYRRLLCLFFLLVVVTSVDAAWQWSWWIQTPLDYVSNTLASTSTIPNTLTREEIQLMRVRDIKRSLIRSHGYSLEDVAGMLDKKELMQALAYEEKKRRSKAKDTMYRNRLIKAVLTAVLGALIIMCWPLLVHGYEVVYINVVVWMDRKRYEASRCRERKSTEALIGVVLMLVVDVLQFWLTASIALSWIVRRNKYMFPTPRLDIQPGQLMGKEIAGSVVGSMGINVAPMALTWLMRFVHGKLENWTGRALSRALKAQRMAARNSESLDERAARKAAKKEARESFARSAPPSWMEPASSPSSIADVPMIQSQHPLRPSSTDANYSDQTGDVAGMEGLD
jgi:hypothetical protein